MEKAAIDIEKILAALQTLQRRVEHVIVEGVGGWLVPIRSDYFISDLAAAMNLAVLVVTQNQLGCLNHAALTVRSVAEHELRCVGLVLNAAQLRDDVAVLTKRRYSQAYSQGSIACRPRRKPHGIACWPTTYARFD